MNRLRPILAIVPALWACESTQPPEPRVMRWEGVAVPTASAAMADTAEADTTYVRVEYEHTPTTDRILATYTTWETDPDPCGLEWLPDGDAACWYMTEAEGVQTPFETPTSRVIYLTLPTLGRCSLSGWVRYPDPEAEDEDERKYIRWTALMRCGENAATVYSIDLLYKPEYR